MNAAIVSPAVERLDLENTEDQAQVFLHRQRYDFALERISPNDSALEIGTGTGYFSEILSRHCKYTGLEIDPESCQRARERVKTSAVVVEGDAQVQPFPDCSFTRIVALEVLEHVPDFRKAVREIYRCLAPNGRVIISVPYRRSGGTNPQNAFHVYEPGAAELIEIFQRYFSNIEVFYQYFPETNLMSAARRFRFRRFFGYDKIYNDLWSAVPSVLNTVRIDPIGKGMRLTLVLVISGKKSLETL
jgi:ubiquinone/menaquinone biosynthesis C-methylase UbiE